MRPRRGYPTRGIRRTKEPSAAGSSSAARERHQASPRSPSPPQLAPPQPQRVSTRAPRKSPPSADVSTGDPTLPPPAPAAFTSPQPYEEGSRRFSLVRSSSTRSMTIYRSRENIATAATPTISPQQPMSRASSFYDRSDDSDSSDAPVSDDSQEDPTPQRGKKKTKTPLPQMTPVTSAPDPLAGVRRQRSPEDIDDPAKRIRAVGPVSPPTHSRCECPQGAYAPAKASTPPAAAPMVPFSGQSPRLRPRSPTPTPAPRSYASAAAELTQNTTSDVPMPSTSAKSDAVQPSTASLKPKYPPIVVEVLPNWIHHLAAIKQQLGRTANARPFGKGFRFTPVDDEEYRLLQRYFSILEQTERVPWYSYSIPQHQDFKIAIRGLPSDSPPELIAQELASLGYIATYVRPIRTRGGPPGCIHHVMLQRNPNNEDVYQVTELLGLTGVVVQGWRGKGRPAQCHRCQRFRHSSHNCHRPLACVRCGGPHPARDCSRPRESPATCVNCGGPHPANYSGCPVLRREARNRRAGTEALSAQRRRPQAPEQPSVAADPQATSLMAPANPAPQQPKNKKKKKKKKSASVATPIVSVATPIAAAATPVAPAATIAEPLTQPLSERPLPPTSTTYEIHTPISTVMLVLQNILAALDAGKPYEDIADVVAKGLSVIMSRSKPCL